MGVGNGAPDSLECGNLLAGSKGGDSGTCFVQGMSSWRVHGVGKGVGRWLKKYFWEGQELAEGAGAGAKAPDAPNGLSFVGRHRGLIGFVLPALFFQLLWWSWIVVQDSFHLFVERSGGDAIPRYYMSITMLFGSLVAGATGQGGASVAFPVMTLVFSILPSVARDFSFMIQSVGMTSATFTILFMKIKIEAHSLVWCTVGGAAGVIFGLEEVSPRLTPSYSKMYFVVIWFAFACSLYWLNRNHHRAVFDEVPDYDRDEVNVLGLKIKWKGLVLLAFGFMGGVFSAMVGSGIGICSFSVLTLLFRVSEKIATPTSVILMAINTCVGFAYRELAMGGVEEDAWGFFAVCVPIVVIGAPLGSLVGSHFHRLVLAAFVYVTDTVQLALALMVVRPWLSADDGGKKDNRRPVHLTGTSGAILLTGVVFFKLMEVAGRRLLAIQEQRMAEAEGVKVVRKQGDKEPIRI